MKLGLLLGLALATSACASLLGISDVETPDFSMTVTPGSRVVTAGKSTTFTIETAVATGRAENLKLAVGAMPAGMEATLTPAEITAGESASLALTVPADAVATELTVSITATGVGGAHTATAHVTIVRPSDFTLDVSPAMQSVAAGASVNFTVSTHATSGAPETVALSVTGLPAGLTATFNPSSVGAGETSTLTVTAGPTTAAFAAQSLTIEAAAPSATHEAEVAIAVTNDISCALEPASISFPVGGTGAYRVTTAITSGPSQTITWALSGLPDGVTGSFSPASITGSGSTTLTLISTSDAVAGNYAVRVSCGTSAGLTQSAQATLRLEQPIVVNGTFETGNLAGWATGGGGSEVLVQDNGNHIAWVGSLYGDSLLYQSFDVPDSGSSRIEATVYQICGDPANDFQSVVVFDENLNLLETLFLGCSDEAVWTRVGADVTPYAGLKVAIGFLVEDFAAPDTMMYVDDVFVTNR